MTGSTWSGTGSGVDHVSHTNTLPSWLPEIRYCPVLWTQHRTVSLVPVYYYCITFVKVRSLTLILQVIKKHMYYTMHTPVYIKIYTLIRVDFPLQGEQNVSWIAEVPA